MRTRKVEITGAFAPWLTETDALALASPRIRAIAEKLLKTPEYRRHRVLVAWLRQQPDALQIIEAMSKIKPGDPPPHFPSNPEVN